jgi:hypothetical protein
MTPESKDMWIDAVLYVCIGIFAFLATYLSSDEAYKYVNPAFLFYAKGVVGVGAAGTGALKMFRSTSFSDHKKSMNGSYTKPPEDKPKE